MSRIHFENLRTRQEIIFLKAKPQHCSSSQVELDSYLSTFSSQATEPSSLASMTLAGFAGKLARLGILSGLSRAGAIHEFPLQFISHLGSVAAEAATMTAISRGGSPWPPSFRQAQGPAPTQEFLKHFVNFGIFRLTARTGAACCAPTQYCIQSAAMMAGHQAAAFLNLEETSQHSLTQQFFDANLATLQIAIGGRLSASITGGRLQRIENNLEHIIPLKPQSSRLPAFRSPLAMRSALFPDLPTLVDKNSLLDPFRDSEATTVRKLVHRSIQWHLGKLRSPQAFLHRDEALKEFISMASFYNTSVQRLLASSAVPQAGNVFPDRVEDVMKIRQNPILAIREADFAYPERSRAQMFIDMRKFLDAAFHSRSSVLPYLIMAKSIAMKLGYSWRDMLEDFREHSTPTQRNALRYLVEAPLGEIPFDEFFEAQMYESREGVYSRPEAKNLIGEEGFFMTPSEFPHVAQGLARGIFQTWNQQGRPKHFEVVEMGCGNGQMAKNILTEIDIMALTHQPWRDFQKSLHYHLVEKNLALQKKQRALLGAYGKRISFHLGSAICDPLPQVAQGVFLSVELLDMFPPTAVVLEAGKVHEIYISSRGGIIQEVKRPLRQRTRDYLEKHPVRFQEGQPFYIQVQMEDWFRNIRKSLREGVVISIDYGAQREHLENMAMHFHTFRRYGNHLAHFGPLREYSALAQRLGFPFLENFRSYTHHPTGNFAPMDFTVDVDFTTLTEIARTSPGTTPFQHESLGDYLARAYTQNPDPSFNENLRRHLPIRDGFLVAVQRLDPI